MKNRFCNNIFKNNYGELRSGWALTMVIALMVVVMIMAQLSPAKESDSGLDIAINFLYGGITIGAGLLLFKALYGKGPRQLGIIAENAWGEFLHGTIMGIISMLAILFVLLLTNQAHIVSINFSTLFSVSIVIELCSLSIFAFSEELLVRGFMMTAMKTTRNKYAVLFLPAGLFSLIHLLNPGFTFLSFVNTVLAGLLFAYLFVKSGKLWLPTGFHIMWNFMQGDIFGMNVSGNESDAVFQTQMGSNAMLTGGEYGPEGGLVVTVVLTIGLIYTHFLIKPFGTQVWTFTSDLPLSKQQS